MKINNLFANIDGALEIIKTYVLNQNKITENLLADIDIKEKAKIKEAIAKEEKKSFIPNEEAIAELKYKIRVLEQKYEGSESDSLAQICELSPLYNELERITSGFSDTDIMAYYINTYNEERSYITGEFSAIQNNNNLVLVYSQFENALKKICNSLKNELKIPIFSHELKGDDIQAFQKYLTKFCKISVDVFSNAEWRYLDTIRKLRNSIVHNNNDINFLLREDIKLLDNQYFLNEISNLEGVVLIDGKLFITKIVLIEEVIKKIEIFYFTLRLELAKSKNK